MINDGDFDIPSVYCTEITGEELAKLEGRNVKLHIESSRIPAKGFNIIAAKNPGALQKVVVTAHIDAYEDSPGASDNAAGTTVLLLLAEPLSPYTGPLEIEFAAINGEDHYSAAGELDYLKRYGSDMDRILLAINNGDHMVFIQNGVPSPERRRAGKRQYIRHPHRLGCCTVPILRGPL